MLNIVVGYRIPGAGAVKSFEQCLRQKRAKLGEGLLDTMSRKNAFDLGFLKRNVAVAALAVSLGALSTLPAQADYEDGLQAFQVALKSTNGDFTKAEDLWIRYGAAGDIRSKLALADIYSGIIPGKSDCIEFGSAVLPADDEEDLKTRKKAATNTLEDDLSRYDTTIRQDNRRALAWYILAGYHDFHSYSQNPTPEEYQAKIVAQQCSVALQSRMRDDEVFDSYRIVEDILASGSEYDLYRLARMYRAGAGVPKDNIKALQFMLVASDRNQAFSGAVVSKDLTKLSAMMPNIDRELAEKLAAEWQPPLPDAYLGKTPKELALDKREQELRARELKLELSSLESEFESNEDLLQSSLAALGFYRGVIDGSIGPESRQAIRRFQYAIASENLDWSEDEIRNSVTGSLSNEQKVELIERAAAREHPQSMYVYGIMHARGIGIPVDGREAVDWWKKSAGYGYSLAHYALGRAYRDGIDGKNAVRPDLTQATFHLGQADSLGYAPAKKELRELRYEYNQATNRSGSNE